MSTTPHPLRFFLRLVVLSALAAAASSACGGSAVTSGDHNVGAGAAAGDAGASGTGNTGARGGVGGTAGAGGGTVVTLKPGSWQMTAVVSESQPNQFVMPCASMNLTLNVVRAGSGYAATVGQDGFIDGPTAEITNGAYVLGGFYLPCGNQVTLSGVTLQGRDSNGDGVADAIFGSAMGMAFSGGGDVIESEAVGIAFTGVPDVSAPTLFPLTEPVDPLQGFVISASEPLTTSAALSLAGTSNLALAARPATASVQAAPLAAFINWSTTVILPLAGQWQVQGTGQDFAGHSLTTSVGLKTLADPGVFAEDGFEGKLIAAVVAGSPTLVKGFGSVSAISGTQSLWLAPGDAVTFHLKRAASETGLHFSARAFGQYGPPSIAANIRAGVVGGQQIAMPTYMPATMSIDTGDPKWPQASEILHFDVPLMDAGSDVLLSLEPSTCLGFCAPAGPLMIDDLTLE